LRSEKQPPVHLSGPSSANGEAKRPLPTGHRRNHTGSPPFRRLYELALPPRVPEIQFQSFIFIFRTKQIT
jgi:hypothetical protein